MKFLMLLSRALIRLALISKRTALVAEFNSLFRLMPKIKAISIVY